MRGNGLLRINSGDIIFNKVKKRSESQIYVDANKETTVKYKLTRYPDFGMPHRLARHSDQGS